MTIKETVGQRPRLAPHKTMFPCDVSTRSLSVLELATLLSEHPEGVEIRRGEEVLFVILTEDDAQTTGSLAWLAEDPERYNRVAKRHRDVQSSEGSPYLLSDTFPFTAL